MTTDLIVRRHTIAPASYDADANTFDATLTTGSAVDRHDARGQYTEKLDTSAIDPASLVGTPVLDGHRNGGSTDVVGVVVAAWREPSGSIAGTIRLSSEAGPIATKVAEGVLRAVSIGYAAEDRRENFDPPTGRRTVTIRPKILEISIVAIPADPQAIIRSKETPPMTTPNDNQPPAENDNTLIETRAQIRAIGRAAGQSAEWTDALIDSGADVTTARAAAFEAMQSRAAPVIRTQAPANDDSNVIIQRRTDALFARVNGGAPDDAARQYFNDGLVDHARALLTLHGVSTNGMAGETIVRTAMHTTSDFTNLLTGVGSRTLMPSYQLAQSPLKQLARPALMSDFRSKTQLKLGDGGPLQKVSEAGEIKSTTRGEAAESYKLDTYGSLFALSRKAIINDDLGAFRDWGIAAGRAAAETEANLLFALLTQSAGAGPTMGEDGKRLFHADHGNLAGTGTVLDIDTLSAARTGLRKMKGLDSKTPISATPRYLFVGPDLEREAEIILAQIADVKKNMGETLVGNIEAMIEPRLNGKSWYLFADPAQLPVFEYAHLSSAAGPQISSREGWDVLGMEFRVVLDFGCGAIDWRGAYRNPGVA